VEGDAVVPLRSALLEGAEHVVLDGVFHRWADALLSWQAQALAASAACL
jgi:hypothetical protein